jgi:hypothetical protein
MTNDDKTKADLADEIAAVVDGVEPTAYEDNSHGVYFDRDDLAALKRWIAVNDETLPESEADD